MDEASCRRWAKVTWSGKPFNYISAVGGEQTVVTRLRSGNVSLKVMEWDGQWQEQSHSTMADELVSTITWLTIEVHPPILVEIRQGGTRATRLLVTTATPAYDETGRVRRPKPQKNYMMVERIRVIIGCDAAQARELKSTVKDGFSLQIFGFAAHLLKQCGSQAQDAQTALRQLWRFTPEQICSAIPSRFHVLATTDRHEKIYMDLARCIDLMASWG